MKNKNLRFILIVILLLIFFVVVFFYIKKNNKQTQPNENISNYIWDNSTEDNSWMCFRKTFYIDQDDNADVVAKIAVDSKYWLYVNDKMVIREGALKRGETPDSIYYDEVDLSRLLKRGRKYNCNSCLVLGRYKFITCFKRARSAVI